MSQIVPTTPAGAHRLLSCFYLADRRFDHDVLKAVICFYRLEVLMEDGDLLLVVPT